MNTHKEGEVEKIVGANIRKERESQGITQLELAEMIGKKSATFTAYIEKGQRNITIKDLYLIARALHTQIENLLKQL